MPFNIPVLTADGDNIHKVDTANAQSLHGLWIVFSKCADYMDQGRRLENLSWRLWTRENFCVEPEVPKERPAMQNLCSEADDLSELSTKVQSAVYDHAEPTEAHTKRSKFSDYRPSIDREDSLASQGRGKEKPITPSDLKKLVLNIKEKKNLELLNPTLEPAAHAININPCPTMPTAVEGNENHAVQFNSSDLDVSSFSVLPTTPEMTEYSRVVHGFSPLNISTSYRSQCKLSSELSPSRNITQLRPSCLEKINGTFTLGGSSADDDGNSFEEQITSKPTQGNSFGDFLQATSSNLSLSSKKKVSDEAVFRSERPSFLGEDTIETDDEASESRIEDDGDSDWDDSTTESSKSSVNEQDRPKSFQRVYSRPNLVSRRSLLTMMMHSPPRIYENTFRSGATLQGSRLTSPDEPLIHSSPSGNDDQNLTMRGLDISRSSPIVMEVSPHSVAYSPRTSRRNMLATELTESFRQHLLRERQQMSNMNAFTRSRIMEKLEEYPSPRSKQTQVAVDPGRYKDFASDS